FSCARDNALADPFPSIRRMPMSAGAFQLPARWPVFLAAGLLLVTVCGCPWAEAEQARRAAEQAEREARRAEQQARAQAEQAAAALQTARAEMPPLPARTPDDKPKDPPAARSASPELAHTFEGHEGTVLCVAFSPNNLKAVSGGADGTI